MKWIETCWKGYCHLLILLLTLGLADSTSAQNFSGLQGKELPPEISGRKVLTSVIDRLRDNDFSGMITSVKVQKDEPLAVSITVSFTGIDQGDMMVSVTDGSKNLLKSFTPQKVAIQKDKKELSVRLTVDSRMYAHGESFMAPRILINVVKNEQEVQALQAFYKLDKKFEIPATDEDFNNSRPTPPPVICRCFACSAAAPEYATYPSPGSKGANGGLFHALSEFSLPPEEIQKLR